MTRSRTIPESGPCPSVVLAGLMISGEGPIWNQNGTVGQSALLDETLEPKKKQMQRKARH